MVHLLRDRRKRRLSGALLHAMESGGRVKGGGGGLTRALLSGKMAYAVVRASWCSSCMSPVLRHEGKRGRG